MVDLVLKNVLVCISFYSWPFFYIKSGGLERECANFCEE